MGGATRLITLLSIPLPPVRPPFLRCRRCISSFPAHPLAFGVHAKPKFRTARLVKSVHSQFSNHSYGFESAAVQQKPQQQKQSNHPWPEWSNFIHVLSNRQEFCAQEDNWILPEDAFVAYEQLSDDFVRAATSCLGFARARPNLIGLLSRRDIEAVVSNGAPFLFRSALDTARRMRAFLKSDGSSVLQVDQANTVDVMKYILSYASNPTISCERNGLYSRELIDTSVRNLLHELSVLSCGTPTAHVPATQRHQVPGEQGVSVPIGQDIVMKKGDWTCPKCKFMNFARNVKCLECDEPRPKKQLTGGEWECPQCSFFNYGRNSVCLRCDCRRPGPPIFYATNSFPEVIPQHRRNQTSELNYGSNTQLSSQTRSFQFPDKNSATDIDAQKNEKEQGEKPEPRKWFKRMMELHESKDKPRTNPDNDFPAMPMPEGEDGFQVSKSLDSSQTSPQASNAKSVPFVPFPPGYFARKDTEKPNVPKPLVGNPSSSDISPDTKIRAVEHKENQNQTQNRTGSVRWTGSSLEGSGVTEPDPLDMSEEAKAERWFKRVAQIKDISELSQIPDEDFPSIMPMRKGVNRFVVSKRKKPLERRLTSQQYRRNLPAVTNDPLKNEGEDT